MTEPRQMLVRLGVRHRQWIEPAESAPATAARHTRIRGRPAPPRRRACEVSFNGSSSDTYYSSVQHGTDPDLIAGNPQPIRSGAWNTGTSWIISQIQLGLPERNETFLGGMEAARPYDLPRLDWSVAFGPHLIGHLVLGGPNLFESGVEAYNGIQGAPSHDIWDTSIRRPPTSASTRSSPRTPPAD